MSGGDPDRFIGNPVNAYLVIKQLMKDLQKFVDTVNTYEKLKGLYLCKIILKKLVFQLIFFFFPFRPRF